MAPRDSGDDEVTDKRIIVYPAYIDALKTVAEGRRVPRDKACPNPHVLEMRDAAQHLGLACEAEEKYYPRDWLTRGRLRVALFDASATTVAGLGEEEEEGGEGDGSGGATPLNPEITTRRELLLRLADLVRRHPSQVEKAVARARRLAATGGGGGGAGAGAGAGGAAAAAGKAKRKRGGVRPCHQPLVEEIAAAYQAQTNQQAAAAAGGPGGGGGGGDAGASGSGAGGGGGKGKKKGGGKKK